MQARHRKLSRPIRIALGTVMLACCFGFAFSLVCPYWLNFRLMQTVKQDFDDPASVKQLLAAGAHVNTRDGLGDTPLILAAMYGHTATVRLLLDHGADVNARNNQDYTALMF